MVLIGKCTIVSMIKWVCQIIDNEICIIRIIWKAFIVYSEVSIYLVSIFGKKCGNYELNHRFLFVVYF